MSIKHDAGQPEQKPGVDDKRSGGDDWALAELELQRRSDNRTDARLSAEVDSSYHPALATLKIAAPSALALDASPLSASAARLKELQDADAIAGLEARSQYLCEAQAADKVSRKLLSDSAAKPRTKQILLKSIRNSRKEMESSYEEKLQRSPEGFMAAKTADNRALRRDYERGRIIQTPFVKDKIREITGLLATGKVVFIAGETGIGKTEAAKIAAKLHSGREPEVVRGYAGMSSSEMFGHMALTTDQEKSRAALMSDIDRGIAAFRQRFGSITPEQEVEVMQSVLSKSASTVSEYVLGKVYKAAEEGATLIFDEANYIPPELLAKLNDILTKRPGEYITVQETDMPPLRVKGGFGLIFTGNVNPPTGPSARRYVGRHQFDLAFQDRISIVEYSGLPQATEGDFTQHPPEQKQLFQIAVTALLSESPGFGTSDRLEKLESRHGTAFIPGGEKGLETLWRFSQYAAVTQQAFAGEIKDGNGYALPLNGTKVGHQTSVALSPRAFMRVLEAWRDEGFQKELDYYIAKDLLQRSLDPKDRAYLYWLGQFKGFFQSEGWDRNPNYDDAASGQFRITIPANEAADAEVVPARAVVEALYGEIPQRQAWPDGDLAPAMVRRSKAAELIEVQARFDALKERLRQHLAQ